MKSFLGAAIAALLLATLGPASAQGTPRYAGAATGGSGSAAGQVNPDGSIARGSGFTARRLGPGEYEIRFPQEYFSSGCAAMVVEGTTTFPIYSTAWQRHCPQRQPVFRVNTYAQSGLLSDQSFAFIALQE
jgi:hypothetical protein